MIEIYNSLCNWELDIWANVLEVIGFFFSIFSFIIALFIKSEVRKLKTQYIFDKRIKEHIKNLNETSSQINIYLNDYNNNKENIRTELSKCQAELQDLVKKLSFWESLKSYRLILYIIRHKNKPFESKKTYDSAFKEFIYKYPKEIYTTTYDNIWIIYNRIVLIRVQVDNISKNKKKSLNGQ